MNLFEELTQREIKCELCGAPTISLHGGGWDNDLIYCMARECGAEYRFPTTTMIEETGEK